MNDDSNRVLTVIKQHIGVVGKILSWLISISSLALSIITLCLNDTTLGWMVVLGIVIFNTLLWIGITIYETLIYKRTTSITNELNNTYKNTISELTEKCEKETKDLSDKLNNAQGLINKLQFYTSHIIKTYVKFYGFLLISDSEYKGMKDHIKELSTGYDSLGEHSDQAIDSCLSIMNSDAEKKYFTSMLEHYNHFLSNICNRLKDILEYYLRGKGCNLSVSLSVKQFSSILSDIDVTSNIRVITTFRDLESYQEKKREIGKREYSITKNSDFQYCLTNRYFIKNNILKSDNTYSNENTEFDKDYNCTIVVPIFYNYPDIAHYYGYLTCDILNENLSINNLLDEKMAEIMEYTAYIIGMFFDAMDCQWAIPHGNFIDFLDVITHLIKNEHAQGRASSSSTEGE